MRGLDYYSHTAFEFVTSELGAQGTVIGGGRYDGLVEMMGGPADPGGGLGSGHRAASDADRRAARHRRARLPLVPIGEAAESGGADPRRRLLRSDGYAVDLGYSGNLARRMRRANRINARAAVLIGEDEIARNVVALRDLDSGEQVEVSMDPSSDELRARLQAFYG